MKKRIIYITIFVISFFMSIFFLLSERNEKEIELGKGYSYIPFQEVIFDVTMFGGNGIYLYKNNKKIPVIFSNIERYNNDSLFIVVEQEFDIKETKTLLTNMIYNPSLYFYYDENFVPLDKKYTIISDLNFSSSQKEEHTAEIMLEDKRISKMIKNKHNYYIIEKKNKKTIGPLTKDEYLIKCKELGISKELQEFNYIGNSNVN